MKYRSFGKTGCQVSQLGFGCMRFPTVDNTPFSGQIKEEEACRMVRYAIDAGVNYIDTAYNYHSGCSEKVLGRILQDGYREKVYLATKSPTFLMKEESDFERFLNEQLERLQTSYIDFYLLHALDADKWKNVVLKFHLLDKLEAARAAGKIRFIGFSFHDDYSAFQTILNGYTDWDFCQIQLNYIDTAYQAGIKGLEDAAAKGMGVVIMEPLLGGKLAEPPAELAKALPDSKSPARWGLEFLWNRPEVSLVLSGMSNIPQIEENLAIADTAQPNMLSNDDLAVLNQAKIIFQTMALVPCTQCSYCMPCPCGLDIPAIYQLYNRSACERDLKTVTADYFSLTTPAAECVQCGICQGLCPQHIAGQEWMPQVEDFFQKTRKKLEK